MDKPLDIENLKPKLKKILQSSGLNVDDIKEERSRIAVYARGRFTCANCVDGSGRGTNYSWTSAFSWLTFDLRELIVRKKWTMKCRLCLAEEKPYFTTDQIEAMFKKAVDIYKDEKSGVFTNIGYGARRTYRQPHYPYLCEKCRWGATCCWVGYRNFPFDRS